MWCEHSAEVHEKNHVWGVSVYTSRLLQWNSLTVNEITTCNKLTKNIKSQLRRILLRLDVLSSPFDQSATGRSKCPESPPSFLVDSSSFAV